MAKNTIPKIMSTRTLDHFNNEVVFVDTANRDYEGEISSMGDTVIINQIGKISSGLYTGKLPSPEEVTSTQTRLVVDKAYYFNFIVKDIEAAQSSVKLIEVAARNASDELANGIDAEFAKEATAKAGTVIGTQDAPIEVDETNLYDKIVDLKVVMNELNVPKSDRALVLSPALVGLLEKDPRYTKYEDVLENGFSGKAAGFQVRESNNVVEDGGVISVYASQKQGVSFADNLVEFETLRSADSFGTVVRGLHVFGLEVVQPDAVAVMNVKIKGSEKPETMAAPVKEEVKEDEKKTK